MHWTRFNLYLLFYCSLIVEPMVIVRPHASRSDLWNSMIYSLGILGYIATETVAAVWIVIHRLVPGVPWYLALTVVVGILYAGHRMLKTTTFATAVATWTFLCGTLIPKNYVVLGTVFLPTILCIFVFENWQRMYIPLFFRLATCVPFIFLYIL